MEKFSQGKHYSTFLEKLQDQRSYHANFFLHVASCSAVGGELEDAACKISEVKRLSKLFSTVATLLIISFTDTPVLSSGTTPSASILLRTLTRLSISFASQQYIKSVLYMATSGSLSAKNN
mmetsp:Transcript_7413/g.11115  ORF Transcript_7413/g.11115 Transcript_7413/m.11115 type:complete len:121 (+) Transcript_7413:662-1024(+)